MSVRVIAIDDSPIVLRRLEQILEHAPDIRLVRKVSDLREAELVRSLSCGDVLLVDMLMPGRSGLAAITELVAHLPVVAVSDAAADSEMAREAIARGASSYVCKRGLGCPEGQERLRRLVREAAAGRVRAATVAPLVMIAGSTGAHRALARLIPALVGLELRTVVLQHLPEGGEEHFVHWLSGLGVRAQLATSGQMLAPGEIVVPPAGHQMRVERVGRVRLTGSEGKLHAPSADVLLSSAVHLGPASVAVILSGLGRDGACGTAELARAGGRILVQSPDECVASSMPEAALRSTPAARSHPIDVLARELSRVHRR